MPFSVGAFRMMKAHVAADAATGHAGDDVRARIDAELQRVGTEISNRDFRFRIFRTSPWRATQAANGSATSRTGEP